VELWVGAGESRVPPPRHPWDAESWADVGCRGFAPELGGIRARGRPAPPPLEAKRSFSLPQCTWAEILMGILIYSDTLEPISIYFNIELYFKSSVLNHLKL